MRNKRKIVAVLLALCLLSGCSLARPEAEEGGALNRDKLIGVFITQEHLDLLDMESYARDNLDSILNGEEISAEDAARYTERLYAVESEEGYDFGIEGIGFFCVEEKIDGVSNSHFVQIGPLEMSQHVTAADEGTGVETTGTVYVQAGGYMAFYVNPVYQDSEGRVYLTAGAGMAAEMTDGISMTQTMSNEVTETRDGVEKKDRLYIEITFQGAALPTGYRVLHMADSGELLRRDEYAAGELPETIEAGKGAAYLIIETLKGDTVSRQLIEKDEDHCTILTSTEREGILSMRWTDITW